MLPDEEASHVPDLPGASWEAGKPEDALLDPAPHESRSGRGRCIRPAALAMVVALLLFAGAALSISGRGRNPPAKGRTASAVLLNGQTSHQTEFGPVPDKLMISGLECPGHHAFPGSINGEFKYWGLTRDGRPYYKRQLGKRDPFWLYYDEECDGDVGGDDRHGVWQINWGGHVATDVLADLDESGSCHAIAYTVYIRPDVADYVKKWYADQNRGAAGGLPGGHLTWSIFCGHGLGDDFDDSDYHWGKVTVEAPGWRGSIAAAEGAVSYREACAAASSAAPCVQGRWVYMRTTMPGETVELTYGVESKTGDSASRGASDSSSNDQGRSFKADAEMEFYVKAGVEHNNWVQASSTGKKKLQQSWRSSVVETDTTKYSFKLSSTPGNNALWQWKFEVIESGSVVAEVRTRDFALTPSASADHRPRCLPGFCDPKDVPHYQKCVKGGTLP